MFKVSAKRVAARHWVQKYAGPLTDVSKLRHQAVFLMGAGGSGKGYVAYKWLKYMPGAGPRGIDRDTYRRMTEPKEGEVNKGVWGVRPEEERTPQERSLTNVSFLRAVEMLKRGPKPIKIEMVDPEHAKVPFRLYDYDHAGRERLIPRTEWETTLPMNILEEVEDLEELIFTTPKFELPAYWRQVNPDIFKMEIPGYRPKTPGYVHEISSDTSKAYFLAAVETGDPIFIDQTGANTAKLRDQIADAQAHGYRVSLVLVWVPLTVNQIRNATRERNVDPDEITTQWKKITKNFAALQNLADKSYVIDNRNDTKDRERWNKNHEEIDAFIARRSNYADLCDLITHESPGELQHYDWVCQGGRILERQKQKRR